MYTIDQISTKIQQGLRWNALYYIVSRLLSTTLTFTLFYRLATHDFSLWANINSTIYLLLLWLDLGLSRSLARYSPSFSQDSAMLQRFVRSVLLFKTGVLLLATPFLFWLIKSSTGMLGLHAPLLICALGALIFLLEGAVSVLKRLYHAQFWHKEFNAMSIIFVSTRMLCSLCLIWLLPPGAPLLAIIFALKLSECVFMVFAGIIRMISLNKTLPQSSSTIQDGAKITKEFIIHSGVMWSTTVIKSLSGRNVLIPLFTYLLGPLAANTFKVANDAALLFQRSILKTIGTLDTSAMTYAGSAALNYIQKLYAQLVGLFAVMLLGLYLSSIGPENEVIRKLFYFLAGYYLLEILLLPYKRLLEVKQHYRLLAASYAFFLVCFAACISFVHAYGLGLFSIVIFICGTRFLFMGLVALQALYVRRQEKRVAP